MLDVAKVDWIGIEDEQVTIHAGDQAYAVRRTLAELQSAELIPFGAVTNPTDDLTEVVDGLMTTHISYQGLEDDNQIATGPLTFDPQALQTMLALPEFAAWREAGGLIVSDELGSQGVRRFFDDTGLEFPHRRVAKDALLAGHDLLYVADFSLEPNDYESQVANIKDTITWFQERYDSDPAFQSRGIYETWGWSYSVLGLGGLGVVIAAYILHKRYSPS